MTRQKLKNDELDAIGANLLKAGKPNSDEIDRVVSNRDVFGSIRARIATDRQDLAIRKPLFTLKHLASSAMAAALVGLVSFGFFSLRSGTDTAGSFPVGFDRPKPDNVVIRPATPPIRIASVAPPFVRSPRPIAAKASFAERKSSVRPKPRRTPANAEGEFYALSNTENIEDAMRRGGRIVRVDMPRSSLFAMGVDLPLENDSKFIRTDVIVGADGVPHAIRFLD